MSWTGRHPRSKCSLFLSWNQGCFWGSLFRSAVFATGNVDVLICSMSNSGSCISHMFSSSLLGGSIKVTFQSKCCLKKQKEMIVSSSSVMPSGLCKCVYHSTPCHTPSSEEGSCWECPAEIWEDVGVSWSNNRNYHKELGRFGSVLSSPQNQNLVQKLIWQRRRQRNNESHWCVPELWPVWVGTLGSQRKILRCVKHLQFCLSDPSLPKIPPAAWSELIVLGAPSLPAGESQSRRELCSLAPKNIQNLTTGEF